MLKLKLISKIRNDLTENNIPFVLIVEFFFVAYFTFLFHEFGHFIVGEVLGNDMKLSLNNATSVNSQYLFENHNLYISIGGPLFTIIQALIATVIIEKIQMIFVYPFVYFAFFCRFFSLVFGGYNKQDEVRISKILNIPSFVTPLIVMLILFLLVLKSSFKLKINVKANGYFFAISTLSILLVIITSYYF